MSIKKRIMTPMIIAAVFGVMGALGSRLLGAYLTAAILTPGIFATVYFAARTAASIDKSFDRFYHDSQTGVYNRHYFDERMGQIIRSSYKANGVLSLLIADIDRFERYIEKYGDFAAEECLKKVIRTLERETRTGDFIARYSADGFAVVLPNTSGAAAQTIAARLITNVRDLGISFEGSDVADHITISIGATTGNVDYHQSGDDYAKRAGEMLFASKQGGRDRYTFGSLTVIAERPSQEATREIENQHLRRAAIIKALNETIDRFCFHIEDNFDDIMTNGIQPVADAMKLNRVCVYRQKTAGENNYLGMVYCWNGLAEDSAPVDEKLAIPNDWYEVLVRGGSINSRLGGMSQDKQEFLEEIGVKAVFMTPVFTRGEFWGMVSLQDHTTDAYFADDSVEADLLQSAAYIIANAVIREDMQENLAEAEDRLKLMLDSSPLCCQLWDRDYTVLDCNEAGVRLYGLKDKQEYLDRFFEFSPEFQPDGRRSDESAKANLEKAFSGERVVFDWMHIKPDGTPIPAKITLARVLYGNDYVVAGYTEDMRGHGIQPD